MLLIRHFPTPWNEKGVLQGSKDISISTPTDEIEKQILDNKKIIDTYKVNMVISSTLKRTYETALFYGYSDFFKEPLIDELNFGSYEGKRLVDLVRDTNSKWINNPRILVLGESLIAFEERIMNFLRKYEGENVLAFAHGAVIRAILSVTEHNSIDYMNKIEVKNNSLTVVYE